MSKSKNKAHFSDGRPAFDPPEGWEIHDLGNIGCLYSKFVGDRFVYMGWNEDGDYWSMHAGIVGGCIDLEHCPSRHPSFEAVVKTAEEWLHK